MPERNDRSAGFTLLEVVFALFLIAICVLATAPMFVMAKQQNAAGADTTAVGALAVRHLERLHSIDYYFLEPGGNLDADIAGYFDDSEPGYLVTWTIADHPVLTDTLKVITVRATAFRSPIGEPRRVTVRTLKGV